MSALPPGPGEPPAVQLLRWVFRPLAFMESCRRRYGDAFSVRFPGFEQPMVLISDPEVVRALYTAREQRLPAGRTFALRPLLGARSVLLLEGREHLDRRRLMLPAFHGERMRAYDAVVREETERQIATWPSGEPFPIHASMQAITLEVILRAVFGVSGERRDRLRDMLRELLDGTNSPALQLGAVFARRLGRDGPLAEIAALRANVDAVLAEEIAERRADPAVAGRDDILSQLIAARFEDGSGMDDAELRDQLMTLLVAGHETTATALAWAFDLLLHHPETLRRLTAEVVAGDDDAYLRAVVSESLRLRPVIPLAGRRLSAELEVGGHVLPAGTDVAPSIWLVNTRADTYPEPFAFRPERFLHAAPSTYAWIPFGGGSRRCLGAAFAEFEMRLVLETVLRRVNLTAADPHRERVARRNVTFAPRHGTRVIARPA